MASTSTAPLTLRQILALTGDLNDKDGDDTARERFRKYLSTNVKEIGLLRDYINECLWQSNSEMQKQYSKALQDLINHLGHQFLGFDVKYGRYQGTPNEIGFDGHWVSKKDSKEEKEFHIVIEVKTTDAYSIKTSTLLGYINELISDRKIPNQDVAMGLYVIGRPDTEIKELINSIVAEKKTRQMRIITVESLLSLAEMVSSYDVTHEDVLAILKPPEPTIDSVIKIMDKLVTGDIDEGAKQGPTQVSGPEPPTGSTPKSVDGEVKTNYWLTPVASDEIDNADNTIQYLVGKEKIYAFGERTPGRKVIKPGDWICFYSTGKGVVAHAKIASFPENKIDNRMRHPEQYPWIIKLDDTKMYLDTPIVVDYNLRSRLDKFKDKDLNGKWGWFVQATNIITRKDFALLTGQS
jgi:hypothetical protein